MAVFFLLLNFYSTCSEFISLDLQINLWSSTSPPAWTFLWLSWIYHLDYLCIAMHWRDAVSAVQDRKRLIAHPHQNGESANVCLRREAVQLELHFKGGGISFPCSASPSNPFSQGFSAVIFFDCRSGWDWSATLNLSPINPRLHTHTLKAKFLMHLLTLWICTGIWSVSLQYKLYYIATFCSTLWGWGEGQIPSRSDGGIMGVWCRYIWRGRSDDELITSHFLLQVSVSLGRLQLRLAASEASDWKALGVWGRVSLKKKPLARSKLG